jgi:hypothetical protein
VIGYANVLRYRLPEISLSRAVQTAILFQYHPMLFDSPDLSRRAAALVDLGWKVVSFDGTPNGLADERLRDGGPDEGYLRSETRRVVEKERRLCSDPGFQRWRRQYVTGLITLANGPKAAPVHLSESALRWT